MSQANFIQELYSTHPERVSEMPLAKAEYEGDEMKTVSRGRSGTVLINLPQLPTGRKVQTIFLQILLFGATRFYVKGLWGL